MKEILVPINLHADVDHLLAYVRSVAIRTDARVTFLYTSSRRLVKGASSEYQSHEPSEPYFKRVRSGRIRRKLRQFFEANQHAGISFRFQAAVGTTLRAISRACKQHAYDLLILGTPNTQGWRAYLNSALASRIISAVNTPVLLVPNQPEIDRIEHITYAVDLSDYDPNVIRQVKSIATIFDAKLTLAHVNTYEEHEQEQYRLSLERTISDTLDYPKVYYKFFDHADIFGGIKKFVAQNNSNLVAMINRKRFSWREIFSPKSLTRRMAQELSVPVLAFSKHQSDAS